MLLLDLFLLALLALFYGVILALLRAANRAERVLGLLLATFLAYYPVHTLNPGSPWIDDWRFWALLVLCGLPLALGLYSLARSAYTSRRP